MQIGLTATDGERKKEKLCQPVSSVPPMISMMFPQNHTNMTGDAKYHFSCTFNNKPAEGKEVTF